MQIRTLTADEIDMLVEPLSHLAKYHNQVASSFSGVYPIVPIGEALKDTRQSVREGTAQAEILIDDQDRVGGCCVAHFHGDTGDIDWVYVREDLQGQGWGKVLMERSLEYLRKHGVGLVDAQVVKGNPGEGFYEGLGFEGRMVVMTRNLKNRNALGERS